MQVKTNAQQNNITPTPMVVFHETDSAESRMYLVLIVGTDENGEEFKDWQFIVGRKTAYDYIKSMVENIDLIESRIVVESETISETKTVLQFMKYVLDTGLIEDPGFDIMDYVVGDYDYEGED